MFVPESIPTRRNGKGSDDISSETGLISKAIVRVKFEDTCSFDILSRLVLLAKTKASSHALR